MTVSGAHREETLCFIILHVVYILFGLIPQKWLVLVMLSQKRMKRLHPWRQLNANSVAVLLKSICHHHWCTRRIQETEGAHWISTENIPEWEKRWQGKGGRDKWGVGWWQEVRGFKGWLGGWLRWWVWLTKREWQWGVSWHHQSHFPGWYTTTRTTEIREKHNRRHSPDVGTKRVTTQQTTTRVYLSCRGWNLLLCC